MMFGKPVVGCRVGGMKEVIAEGVTGLLAEPGDPESLRAALAGLLADPAKRETFGKAGRERFLEHYTREKLTDRTLAFYREVLAKQFSDQLPGQVSDQAKTEMVTTQAG
jgi:glycosyltransferase involved in cell wall biosynthesis